MNMQEIRETNLKVAKGLGYPVNERLPFMDEVNQLRSLADAAERLLCLNAVVACSYGFPKDKAIKWLIREGAFDHLAQSEQDYLYSSSNGATNAQKQWQVESIWALAWCVGCHDDLDFADSCSDSLIQMLPNLAKDVTTEAFKMGLKLRAKSEIVLKADLVYCLHWAVRNAEINGQRTPGKVPANVVAERRRALEWMISQDDWDEVTLDT
ncbi:MAG: DUF4272 domain-containing protein [Flavobacteriales bacterium]|nr:DUF4272 domain-containing protein [Flavobacteriales bacterium]